MSKPRSERRQRTALVALRLLPDEHEMLLRAARRQGISLSELLRSAALDAADPREPQGLIAELRAMVDQRDHELARIRRAVVAAVGEDDAMSLATRVQVLAPRLRPTGTTA